jgi:hypothetical protein
VSLDRYRRPDTSCELFGVTQAVCVKTAVGRARELRVDRLDQPLTQAIESGIASFWCHSPFLSGQPSQPRVMH